jgi:hypothetical protein
MILSYSFSFAQLPVSHSPQNKKVVLEEFTGIHCGYCPDGHRRGQAIEDAHPNDVVLINIHTGGYATPQAGEPDFRTSFGSAIAGQTGLTGYPSGSVNRHVFSGSSTAMGRGDWSGAATQILGETSYCNVALETSVDFQTREMTVNVEVYYTGNSPEATNLLNVALLQDNVEGPQSGGSGNPAQILPNGKYNHMHMLRHLLTGQWGETISTTTQGTLFQQQYTYTLPADINGLPLEMGNLKVVAFVAETHQEIISAGKGTITYVNLPYNNNAVMLDPIFNSEICSDNQFSPTINVKNFGSQEITSLAIEYDVNGNTQTHNWTGSILPLGKATINLPQPAFAVLDTNSFNVVITSVNGVPDEDTSNNSYNNNIIKTTNEGFGTNYVVKITQDRYGSETRWKIVDSNDAVVAYGGPYADLASAGTQLHTHNVVLNNNECYTFYMLDSYGDGMTYGAGAFKMVTAGGPLLGETVVFNGNGNFTSSSRKPFSTYPSADVDDAFFAEVNIYPNPSEGVFMFENVAEMSVEIYNMAGSLIYKEENLPNNKQINLNALPNGIYFAKLIQGDKVGVKKIIIAN